MAMVKEPLLFARLPLNARRLLFALVLFGILDTVVPFYADAADSRTTLDQAEQRDIDRAAAQADDPVADRQQHIGTRRRGADQSCRHHQKSAALQPVIYVFEEQSLHTLRFLLADLEVCF